jgi:signal peptidase II
LCIVSAPSSPLAIGFVYAQPAIPFRLGLRRTCWFHPDRKKQWSSPGIIVWESLYSVDNQIYMKARRILRTLMILILLGSNIGCDQISKSIVRQRIDFNEHIFLIADHLTLMKVENTGAFLSLGHAFPEPVKTFILVIIPLMLLGAAFVYVLTKRNLSSTSILGIGFVVGGGAGNIYDRIVYGSVTDFVHIDFVIFQTGVFNMADVSVTTGMLILLYELYAGRRITFDAGAGNDA